MRKDERDGIKGLSANQYAKRKAKRKMGRVSRKRNRGNRG